MKVESIPCDVVILPNPLLAQMAIEASRDLTEFGTKFTLKEGEYYPHTSLYMLQLKEEDIYRVEELLSVIAQATTPLQLTVTSYDQAEGYIDVEYARDEAIDLLQDEVVKALNPVRDGMRVKDKARMVNTQGVALENLKQYGYRSVGELFRPHITFTRLNSSETIPQLEKLLGDAEKFSGLFTRIGLFEMGDNGTCVRKISEFDFLG